MIKTAVLIGGSYAVGSIAGGKLADVAGFKTEGARAGTKIATGIVVFFFASALLR